jgi:hypothetical protein
MSGNGAHRALWTCPRCKQKFVNRNNWHSCVRVARATHFRGKSEKARTLFAKFERIVRRIGPVRAVTTKTRTGFMARVRFAGAEIRKDYIRIALWLTRRADHPALDRIERPMPTVFIHRLTIRSPGQMDAGFRALVREAYAVGQQKHLLKSDRAGSQRPRSLANKEAP